MIPLHPDSQSKRNITLRIKQHADDESECFQPKFSLGTQDNDFATIPRNCTWPDQTP